MTSHNTIKIIDLEKELKDFPDCPENGVDFRSEEIKKELIHRYQLKNHEYASIVLWKNLNGNQTL